MEMCEACRRVKCSEVCSSDLGSQGAKWKPANLPLESVDGQLFAPHQLHANKGKALRRGPLAVDGSKMTELHH